MLVQASFETTPIAKAVPVAGEPAEAVKPLSAIAVML